MTQQTHSLAALARSLKPLVWPGVMVLLAVTLSACGGTGLRQEPLPLVEIEPIASASDPHLIVSLDTLIVRDGPGSWARNADWDEYQLTIQNRSGTPVLLDRIVIVDSFSEPIAADASRKSLVRGSREVVRRHEDADIDIKAGAGSGLLFGSGAAVSAMGLGTASLASTGALISGGTASVGSLTAVASGLLIAGPALITTGVVRSVNNAKVDEQIEIRHTPLPLHIDPEEQASLKLFFPIVPSPRYLLLSYSNGTSEYRLAVDTSSKLEGLHVTSTEDAL